MCCSHKSSLGLRALLKEKLDLKLLSSFLSIFPFLFDSFILLVPVLNLICALHCFHCFLFCHLLFMGTPYLGDVLPVCSPSCMFCFILFCFVLQAFVMWMPPETKMCSTTHLFVHLVVTLLTYSMQNIYTLCLTRLSMLEHVFQK